jgi:hypothetical protein
MATDGGGGGGYSGDPGARGAGAGGSEGGRFMRTVGGVDLRMDGEAEPQLVPAPAPPPPASVKTWISGGRTSCNDPMTHYLYNGSG